VRRALYGLFQGAVGKDVVSRAWRKVKVDWDAWCARSLAEEDIVRLILDGTVIRTRLDKKATNISVLAAIGVRRDGQKILLSIRHMGGESTSAWRQFLDDLDARGLKRPDFVIVDGAPGLEAALTALWGAGLPIQRCTVHKHRNLLGHAPKHLHDELTEDYRDMIYAETAAAVDTRRKAFLRKWRLKCRAVADSLEEAGEQLFAFTRLDPSQWRSARTTNAIERLNEEFRRRIKTQTVLPCADTVPMLLWPCSPPARSPCARSTDGRPCPSPSSPSPLTTLPDQAEITALGERRPRISTNSQTRPAALSRHLSHVQDARERGAAHLLVSPRDRDAAARRTRLSGVRQGLSRGNREQAEGCWHARRPHTRLHVLSPLLQEAGIDAEGIPADAEGC
jgi:putative transposase